LETQVIVNNEIFRIRPTFFGSLTNPLVKKLGFHNVNMMRQCVFFRQTEYQAFEDEEYGGKNQRLFPFWEPEIPARVPERFELLAFKKLIEGRDLIASGLSVILVNQNFINFLESLGFKEYRLYSVRIYFIEHHEAVMIPDNEFNPDKYEFTDQYFVLQLTNPVNHYFSVTQSGYNTENRIIGEYFDKEFPLLIRQVTDGFDCTRKFFDAFMKSGLNARCHITRRRVIAEDGLLSAHEDDPNQF
jgi:hypothetical protein